MPEPVSLTVYRTDPDWSLTYERLHSRFEIKVRRLSISCPPSVTVSRARLLVDQGAPADRSGRFHDSNIGSQAAAR